MRAKYEIHPARRVFTQNHNQAITCEVAAQDVKDLFRLRRVQFTDWQQRRSIESSHAVPEFGSSP